MRVTIKDVAKHANVSASSVSRYINDPESVRMIPALKIQQAIQELGYIPNTFAQSLKRGVSKNVGIILPSLGPYYSAVCAAVSDFFYQHKYLLYICHTGENLGKESYYINSLMGQQIAGLIIVLSGNSLNRIEEIGQSFRNLIVCDYYSPDSKLDFVYEDIGGSVYCLTKHLIETGYTKFIFLFRKEFANDMTPSRLNETKRALEDSGLRFEDMDTYFDLVTEAQVHDRLSHSLGNSTGRVAVVGYSPTILEYALISLNRLGLRVPQDVQLAGLSLGDFYSKYRLDIPCIIQNPYELGINAANLLLQKIKKPSEKRSPKNICLPTRFSYTNSGEGQPRN